MLAKVAQGKDDREQAEAFQALSSDQEIDREVQTFTRAVEARFGADSAREIIRASASNKPFKHTSVSESQQDALDAASRLYATARGGERQLTQAVETERLAARQMQGITLKP